MAQPPRYITVPLLGPDGAGKTALLQALGGYVQRREGLLAPPLRAVQASDASVTVLDVRIARGFLQLVDFPSAEAEGRLLGATPFPGAVLVVSAADSVLPGTLRSLTHAREAGIPRVVVALTKCDLVQDSEMIDLVTMEIRELLNKHEYRGDTAPVVGVSAVGAGREGERGMAALAGLLDAADRWIV